MTTTNETPETSPKLAAILADDPEYMRVTFGTGRTVIRTLSGRFLDAEGNPVTKDGDPDAHEALRPNAIIVPSLKGVH